MQMATSVKDYSGVLLPEAKEAIFRSEHVAPTI